MASVCRTTRCGENGAMNTLFKFCAIGLLLAISIGGLVVQRAGITELREGLVAARLKNEAVRKSHSLSAARVPKTPPDLASGDFSPSLVPANAERQTASDEFPWKDKGNASPESALETAMWAASRGDVDALARLLLFESKAREVAESLRANLPAESRTRFPTAESLVALLLARQAPLEGIEVIGRSDVADGGVLLRVAMAGPHGTSKLADFAFMRGADGWRLVVTSELASHAADLLRH